MQFAKILQAFYMLAVWFFIWTFSFNLTVQYQDIPADERAGLHTAAMALKHSCGFVNSLLSAVCVLLAYVACSLPVIVWWLQITISVLVFLGSCLTYWPPDGGVVKKGVEITNRVLARIGLICYFILMMLMC